MRDKARQAELSENLRVDIFMPIFIGDYLKDTQHLDAARHGCYLLWLMHYWTKGPLPNSLDALTAIGRLRGRDARSVAQGLLSEFFTLEADGLYHQKREDLELARARAKKQKAHKQASHAANVRWERDAPSNAPSSAPSSAPSNAPSMPAAMPGAMLEQCPSPSPSPVTTVSDANASSPRRTADGDSEPDPNELIYGEYPRKEGHGAAITAIAKAVERIRKGEKVIPPIPDLREARLYLYQRTHHYARSPAGSRADKTLIPHPATWFNQSRYLDDESNWQHTGEQSNGGPGTNQPSPAKQRIDGARRKLAEIAVKRGLVNPFVGNGPDGEAMAFAGPGGVDRGLAGRPGTASPEVLPPAREGRAG